MNFGTNYVPSKDWFYSWQHLDLDNVDEDFSAISELGMDHVRLHLRWDLFQPNASYIPDIMLKKLAGMLDLATKYTLKAEVTVFDGWMSGFWFLPSFIGDRSIITDANVVEAEFHFLDKLAQAIGGHSALMGIDIGNEINVYDTFKHTFTVQEGDAWLKGILAHCDRLFPNKANVVGVDHQPWFADTQFSRKTLSNTGGMTSLHTWIGFSGATSYGCHSEECLHLQEFNIELANAYAEDLSRKVWIQEYGITDLWMKPEEFELYVRESMISATRSDNLWGFTWWCSHDVSSEYRDFNPMEHALGLLDVNNKIKPLGNIVKRCIEDLKNGLKAKALPDYVGIIIDEGKAFDGWTYGRAFANQLRNNRHVKFVLSGRAGDSEYLRERGIRELIPAVK
jgi:hypothetical protein